MTSFEALIRVSATEDLEIISVSMPSTLAPMANALVSSVLGQKNPEPGVYRLEVETGSTSVTDPTARKIALHRVAGPKDAVALLTLRRDGLSAVSVKKVEKSDGGSAQTLVAERLRTAVSEVAARVGQEIEVGETCRVEVVLVATAESTEANPPA